MAVIVLDGLRRMYFDEEDIFYYITLMNENYEMPILPLGSTEGICRGIYKLSSRDLGPQAPKVQLFGSGAILRESLRAQDLLEKHFGVGSNVYSVTSYKSLYDDGRACNRWNRLHPTEPPRRPYVTQALDGESGPVVAASDYVSAVGLSIAPWVCGFSRSIVEENTIAAGGSQRIPAPRPLAGEGPGVSAGDDAEGSISSYVVLGTDGFGRSEARRELRRFFEVDAENIALTALFELAQKNEFSQEMLPAAIKTLGLDTDKSDPVSV